MLQHHKHHWAELFHPKFLTLLCNFHFTDRRHRKVICLLLFNKPGTNYTEFSLLKLFSTLPIWANSPLGSGCSWAKLNKYVLFLDSKWMMHSFPPAALAARVWKTSTCPRADKQRTRHRYPSAALHFQQPLQLAPFPQLPSPPQGRPWGAQSNGTKAGTWWRLSFSERWKQHNHQLNRFHYANLVNIFAWQDFLWIKKKLPYSTIFNNRNNSIAILR